VPGEERPDRDVTVHPVPALHGIGGDEPVKYEFSPDGGPARFLGYVLEIGGLRLYHSGDCLVYPELPATLSALAPDVLMIPINGCDHMREARGIVGNMNETEAAWLCAQVALSYVIPMHYECIAGNTGDPGHFTTLIRESETPATVLALRAPPPSPSPSPNPASRPPDPPHPPPQGLTRLPTGLTRLPPARAPGSAVGRPQDPRYPWCACVLRTLLYPPATAGPAPENPHIRRECRVHVAPAA
jgi:Beta-lactamase superfamily domain